MSAPPLTVAARQVIEHLDYLEETWPDLVTIGVERGTRRRMPSPRRGRSDEAAQREAMAEAAERRQPGWVPGPGARPVPIDVDMLDLIVLVVSTAEDLGTTITQVAGVERPAPAASSWEDPRPYLRSARAWLTAAHDVDAETVPWAARLLAPVVRRVASAVGEILDGQVLDALCPWCGGRTDRDPNGGARTLVVHVGAGATTGARPETTEPGATKAEGPLIVCHGSECSPPESACGRRWREQPAWPEREWDWLAKQLVTVDTPSSARVTAS